MGGDALAPAMGGAFPAFGAGLCLRYVFCLARRLRLLWAARRFVATRPIGRCVFIGMSGMTRPLL